MALLLKDKKGELVELPTRNELSSTRYQVNVTPRPDGRATLAIAAEYKGEDAIDMRDDLLPLSESARTAYLQDWLEQRRPGSVLNSHEIENLGVFREPLKIEMEVESPGLVTVADGIIVVQGCTLSCIENNPLSRRARAHPFYVDRGWNLVETVTIHAPEGMKPALPATRTHASSSVGRHTLGCVTKGDSAIKCTRTFVAQRYRWSPNEYPGVRDMFDKIVQADQTKVAFQSD